MDWFILTPENGTLLSLLYRGGSRPFAPVVVASWPTHGDSTLSSITVALLVSSIERKEWKQTITTKRKFGRAKWCEGRPLGENEIFVSFYEHQTLHAFPNGQGT